MLWSGQVKAPTPSLFPALYNPFIKFLPSYLDPSFQNSLPNPSYWFSFQFPSYVLPSDLEAIPKPSALFITKFPSYIVPFFSVKTPLPYMWSFSKFPE